MDWEEIRAAYKKTREDRGLDQHQVEGTAQAMVSKLEKNHKLGPTVGTFVKAVQGLGVPVWLFFRQIEVLRTGTHPQDDRITPAPKAVPSDEAAQTLEQLRQRIEVLEKGKETWLKGLTIATVADAERHQATSARNRQSAPSTRDGKPRTRRVDTTLRRAAGGTYPAPKKALKHK